MDIKTRIAIIESSDIEENILHQLLELAMAVTGIGYISDDYTKFIEFDIGNLTIFSDPYYNRIQIDETDLDSDSIMKIIEDVKKRLIQFDEKITTTREKLTSDIFNEPMGLDKNEA